MKKSWHLDRRLFLRGASVSLALPMMEAMLPTGALAAAARSPKRMLCVGVHLGFYGPQFFPKQIGKGYTTPALLKPIEDFRQDFTVFSGLDHAKAAGRGHPATVNFLTGFGDPKKRKQMSMDQVAARAVGGETRFASLQLECGSNKQKGRHLSWAKGGTPLPLESNPKAVFDRLFAAAMPAAERKQLLADQRSILDHVLVDAHDLQRKLGKADQEKLDEYLSAIREVERSIQKEETFGDRTAVAPSDLVIPRGKQSLVQNSRTMYQLTTLAFQADLTRVVTLRIAGEKHASSHHGKKNGNVKAYVENQKRYVTELARALKQLKTTQDANGPLLDNTMVLFGSGLGNSASHSTKNLPILLAGGGLKHGRHLKFAGKAKKPLSNLYVTMLQQMGIKTEKFSQSRGSLNSLLT